MAMPLMLIWDLIATDNASEVFARVGKSAQTAAKETSGIGPALQAAGAIVAVAAIGIGVVATKMAIDFQAVTAKVQGNAQISAKAAASIGDAFLKTAGNSTFSAASMQSAFAPVAGVIQQVAGHTLTAADATQVMAAATTLAEASGAPLADTTANLAKVMQNYGIGVAGAADASNTLFNTSRVTGVGLDDLTTVVDKLHGKLGIASPDLANTSGLLVDLAEHGISGSKGVMVANTAFTTLLGGSKATSKELKDLGVNVFDSSGKFVGMQSALEQLTPKLAGMSDKQRIAAENALFGKGAAEAMNSTIMAGGPGFQAAAAAVSKHGAAESAAKAAAGTLEGQMKTLRASFSDYMVMLGQKIIPIVQQAINWMKTHQETVKNVATAVGILCASLVTISVAMSVWKVATVAWTVVQGIATAAMWLFTAACDANPIGLVVLAIAALVAGFILAYTHCKTFRDIITLAFDAVKLGAEVMALGVVTYFGFMINVWLTVVGAIIDGAASAFSWVPGLGPKLQTAADNFDTFKDNANTAIDKVKTSLKLDVDTDAAKVAVDAMVVYGDTHPIHMQAFVTTSGAINTSGGAPLAGAHLAKGTNYAQGGMTLVGEQGAELVDMRRGAKVYTASETSALLNGGGGGDIYVQNPFTGDYLLAQVADVAGGVVAANNRTSLDVATRDSLRALSVRG